MSELIFNGHDFSTLFDYGDPEITILDSKADIREISGRNGGAFVGMTYGTATVTFTITALGSASDRRAAFSTLGQWLMVVEPKQLYLPDTPDRYYLAVPNGALDVTRVYDAEYANLTFTLIDPVAYGTSKTASLPSGGSASITVNGTAPTYLDVVANSATRNSSSLVWGVRVDGVDFVHMATGSSSSRKVEIYSQERICKLSNALTLPTLDSNWLVLNPGSHTVSMDNGTGAATLSWVERWY